MNTRPRIPSWVAVAIPAAAYGARSVMRGSLAPDLPADAIVFGALLAVLAASAFVGTAAQRRRDELADEMKERDDCDSGKRQRDEIDTDVDTSDTRGPGSTDYG